MNIRLFLKNQIKSPQKFYIFILLFLLTLEITSQFQLNNNDLKRPEISNADNNSVQCFTKYSSGEGHGIAACSSANTCEWINNANGQNFGDCE